MGLSDSLCMHLRSAMLSSELASLCFGLSRKYQEGGGVIGDWDRGDCGVVIGGSGREVRRTQGSRDREIGVNEVMVQ